VITNDSGLVDYSLIDMTVQGGEGYDNLLVSTNENGLIDYSLIDMTTGKAANKLVKTLSSGLININLLPASTTGAVNTIPKTTSSSSVLSNTWLDKTDGTDNNLDKNKVVVTDSNKQINNNLLNATDGSSTTLANNKDKVVKTNSEGKISYNLIKNTSAGGSSNANTLVKLDANGLLDSSLFRSNQFLPLTGGITTGNIIINGASPASSTVSSINSTTATFTGIDNLKASMPYFTGISGNSYSDGFLLGMNGSSNTNNYLMLATYDEGTEPIYVRQYIGNPGYTGLTQKNSITLMDKDGYTSVNRLTVTSDIVSSNGGLRVANDITSTAGNLSINGSSHLNGPVRIEDDLVVAKNLDLVDGNIIINSNTSYPSDPVNQTKLAEELPNFSGFSSCAYTDGCLIGMNLDENAVEDTDTYLLIATYDNGNEPIIFRQYQSWNKTGDSKQHFNSGNIQHELTLMDKAGNTTLNGLTVSGITTLNDRLIANKGINIPVTGDKIGNSSNDANAPLIIGSQSGLHLSFDENEISARSNGTGGSSSLNLNPDGGSVVIGSNQAATNNAPFTVFGEITANNGLVVNNSPITITTGQTAELTSGKVITQIEGYSGGNDCWRIGSGTVPYTTSGSDTGYGFVELAVSDDGAEDIYVRQYGGGQVKNWDSATIKNTLTLLDRSGNTGIPHNLTVGGTLTVSSTGNSSFAGKVTTGSFKTGAIESSSITNTGALVNNGSVSVGGALTVNNNITANNKTVTAGNFNGKWSGFTQQISTKPPIANDTWILLNNNSNIQHTTVGDIANVIKDTVGVSDSGTYYTKLSNGLKIQWGSGIEKGSDQIISFPIAFLNTNYQVVISATASYGGADPTYVKSKTTTGFYASNDYWDNMRIYWIAVGY
jgi:hypothetical protein